MKTRLYIAFAVLATLLMSSCADEVAYDSVSSIDPVGFWYGFWHGLIVTIAWIVSLFNDDVAIYAAYNNGGWYDFGFILGIYASLDGVTKSD